MSIRIKNNENGRIIIIKNQNDINDIKKQASTIDTDPTKWDMTDFGKEFTDDNDDYNLDDLNLSDEARNLTSNRYTLNFNSQFNLDTFDDAPENHYIATFTYPEDDESDPSSVHAPLFQLKDPDIDDDIDDTNMKDFSLDSNGQENEEDQDNNYQGMIRTVRGAYLVYKKKTDKGTFEEVWIYNVGKDLKTESNIRKAILSGTDINPNTNESDDGQQKAKSWTIGNVQFLTITGLVQ